MDIKEIMYIIKTDSARLIALLVVVLAVCTIYYARLPQIPTYFRARSAEFPTQFRAGTVPPAPQSPM